VCFQEPCVASELRPAEIGVAGELRTAEIGIANLGCSGGGVVERGEELVQQVFGERGTAVVDVGAFRPSPNMLIAVYSPGQRCIEQTA
jgi:hypothetical protein